MNKIKIDKILRSRRRTFSIEIKHSGELIIRAPLKATIKEINDLVLEKSNWILRKREEVNKKAQQKIIRLFADGEIFECLGKKYILRIRENYKWAFSNKGNELIINSQYQQVAKNLLIHWYKSQAIQYISPRALQLSELLGLKFKNIKINNARTRWGSCSAKKNLNFSWRLLMAPKQVVDYVIVHELAHLVEMNHSPKFWDTVRKALPNYLIYETWLDENGHLLDL